MPFEIVPPGTDFDFIGKRNLAAVLSVGLIVAGLVAIPLKGINWGIDFAGGTEIQVKFAPGVAASDGRIREIVSGAAGIEDPSVVRYGEEAHNEFLIKFRGSIEEALVSEPAGRSEESNPAEGEAQAADEQAAADAGEPEATDQQAAAAEEEAEAPDAQEKAAEGQTEAAEAEEAPDRLVQLESSLAEAIGPLSIERVEFVGPRVGAELRNDGLLALFWASLAMLVYITFRFSSRFAPGAVVAVIHDLLITAGVFVILGLEFDLRILAAMLAILGYSLNDTIIIYDRIRENLAIRSKADLPVVLNQSVNQTLSRTVLTSGTTMAALLSLFFLGGDVIRPFAFAMILGVIVGTYSSIFIAAPVLLFLERARS